MMARRAKFYKWENVFKGSANHRRLEILELLSKDSDLTSEEISQKVKVNYHTGARHVRRLSRSGLIYSRRAGNAVKHSLSPLGKSILTFAQKLK